jgi:nucleoside-diphosphate-sugar epimerase
MSTVLVTGGSGFIGCHCILQLLQAGHEVRATLRTLQRSPEVHAMLRQGGVEPGKRLSCTEAHLESDGGWATAVAGCDYVLHVASPFPAGAPRNDDELVGPAREGTLRVLSAARAAGVRRVVLTSSFAAIGYGQPARTRPFDEHDWTNLDARLSAYVRSKTVAERAAWEFIARPGTAMELAVINPAAVFGPVLGADYSTSIMLLQRMLEGAMPANPRLYFGVVDVRDVADLHLRAMTHPAARGERFLAVAGDAMSLSDIARVLKSRLGSRAARVATREAPNWLVRLAALRDRAARDILPELGKPKDASNAKARELLGWAPRSNEQAILAAAQSLEQLGLLKTRPAAA